MAVAILDRNAAMRSATLAPPSFKARPLLARRCCRGLPKFSKKRTSCGVRQENGLKALALTNVFRLGTIMGESCDRLAETACSTQARLVDKGVEGSAHIIVSSQSKAS